MGLYEGLVSGMKIDSLDEGRANSKTCLFLKLGL